MNLLLNMFYPLFLSFWRRCFGSNGWHKPVLENRFFQHILGFLFVFVLQYVNGLAFIQNILSCAIFQGLFWARSHGCCFDYGHGDVDLKRYDQLWYWNYIKKFIPQHEWYTFTGDYILMFVRYSLPAILMSLVLLNPTVSLMGFVLSSVYAFCWKLYDWKYINNPTELAEWMSGFLIGLFFIGL